MVLLNLILVAVVLGITLWNRMSIEEIIKQELHKLQSRDDIIEKEQELARSRARSNGEIQQQLMTDVKDVKGQIDDIVEFNNDLMNDYIKKKKQIEELMKDYEVRQQRYAERCAANARRFNKRYKNECVSKSEIADSTQEVENKEN